MLAFKKNKIEFSRDTKISYLVPLLLSIKFISKSSCDLGSQHLGFLKFPVNEFVLELEGVLSSVSVSSPTVASIELFTIICSSTPLINVG